MELHHTMEIEELKTKLSENKEKYSQLQYDFSLNYEALLTENKKLVDEHSKLKERYERLLECNRKLQKNNHVLESKLLTIVDNISEEKNMLRSDLSNQTSKLMDAKLLIVDLYEALERYRVDCNLALHLLQNGSVTPSMQPVNKLPLELQSRIEKYLPTEVPDHDLEHSNSTFPTFPPTATFYTQVSSREKQPQCIATADIIGLLAKSDELPERTRKILLCNQCLHHRTLVENSSQTDAYVNDSSQSSFSRHGLVHHV